MILLLVKWHAVYDLFCNQCKIIRVHQFWDRSEYYLGKVLEGTLLNRHNTLSCLPRHVATWDWNVWKLKFSFIAYRPSPNIEYSSMTVDVKIEEPSWWWCWDAAGEQWAASQHLRSSTSQSGGEKNWGNYFQEAGIVQDTRNNQSIYTSTPKTCVIMIFSGDKRSILTQSH